MKKMANTEIRDLLKTEAIAYWQLADVLGVHENTIVRRLRHELSERERDTFMKAIEEAKAKRE